MPISRKDSFNIQIYQIADALLVALAFWWAGIFRNIIAGWQSGTISWENEIGMMMWALYIAVPFTPLALEHFRFYQRSALKMRRTAALELLKGLTVICLVLAAFAVFAKLVDTRRLILGFGMVFTFVFILIRHLVTQARVKARISSGIGRERVILAGVPEEIDSFVSELDAETLGTWSIACRFDLPTRRVEDLYQLLRDESVSRVIFATKGVDFDKVARAVEACELQGVEAWVAASFIRTQIARPVFDTLGDKPMLVLRSTPELSWELMLKNFIDRAGAALLIFFTLPLWLIAWIGIRLKSPGAPVFFSQLRAGEYGRPFKMWKFRTMVANAEELLEKIKQEHGNQMEGPVFKLDQDPRIFPFGAMLRKLSIDELPQLLNVFTGDMSLVGPRPLPLYEVAAFSKMAHRRRLSVKPGITCTWQAGGRNKITSFEDWVEMDLKYIDNWSLWLDVKILARTVPAVLFSKGAK